MEIQWRTWDMRDNWMSHREFSEGDTHFAISHTMLVDRIQYLPGNQIEGNQTLMVRAILDDDASTNLVVHVSILVSEPKDSQGDPGFTPGFTSMLAGLSLLGTAMLGRHKDD